MATVTIYTVRCYQAYMADETGTSFALTPWRGDTQDYKGETLNKGVYVLPDGFIRIADDDSVSGADYKARESSHAKFVDANGDYWTLGGRERPCLTKCDLDGRQITLSPEK